MSVSVVASSDGNSAVIKVNGVERLRVNADGSLVASGSPAAGVRGNVLATMQAFANEFAALAEENGYLALPNGFVFQWLKATPVVGTSDGAQTLNWPIAFPQKALHASVTTQSSGVNTDDAMYQLQSHTRAQVTVYKNVFTTNSSNVTALIFGVGH